MSHDRRRRPAERPDPAPGMRPSERASERLAADMRAEIGMTRAAWDDALRRSDEHLHQGDDAGALASLEDQRRLLRLLEHRLHRTVAAAAAERDAEEVLAGVDRAVVDEPRQPTAEPPVEPASSRGRLRALVAAGAATAVTAVAVGLAALAGPVGAPAPQIAGGPEGTDEQVATDDGVGTAGHGPAVPAPSVERAPWLSEWSHLFSAPPSGDTSGSEAGSRPQRDGDTADGADSASRDVGEATRDAGDAGSADGGADADETEDDATDPTGDESEADDRRLLDLEGLLRPEDADGRDDDPRGDALGDDDLDGRDEPEESQSGLSRTETEGRGPSLPGFGG